VKSLIYILLSIPVLIHAQIGGVLAGKQSLGIRFEKEANWNEIVAKAESLKKYIFVDCYATWCGPCSKMTRDVFETGKVGDYMNERFISVQVQMDTSKMDSRYIEAWYGEAKRIGDRYRVKEFPTYLFFSPEGKIVHRYLGAMSDSLFLRVAGNSLNSDKQYYTLLAGYEQGKRDYGKLEYLARFARAIGDDSIANVIAQDVIHNYLNGLAENDFCRIQHLDFIRLFSSYLRSKDAVFKYTYENGDKVDSAMGMREFSRRLVSSVITKEEISPTLAVDEKANISDPEWDKIFAGIRGSYGEKYASSLVLESQLRWYTQRNNWNKMIKYHVAKIERYGMDTVGVGWALMNNIIYEVFFKHCDDVDTLSKAIRWMEVIDRDHPDDHENMDTYANLLYKVGRTKEAIYWEERAVGLEHDAANRERRKPDPAYDETIRKMKNGIPTW
jgi:thioredoxin-related protein